MSGPPKPYPAPLPDWIRHSEWSGRSIPSADVLDAPPDRVTRGGDAALMAWYGYAPDPWLVPFLKLLWRWWNHDRILATVERLLARACKVT